MNKDGKKAQYRPDLGRLTEAEYEDLTKKHPANGKKRKKLPIGRMTEDEYKKLWRGKPPK